MHAAMTAKGCWALASTKSEQTLLQKRTDLHCTATKVFSFPSHAQGLEWVARVPGVTKKMGPTHLFKFQKLIFRPKGETMKFQIK